MRAFIAAVAFSVAGFPALAVEPLTADEFEAYATGKTLTYALQGQVWGTEQYLPDHHVIWAFTGMECRYGIWYAEHSAICFVYGDDTDAHCWLFFAGVGGLTAMLTGDAEGGRLAELGQSTVPMDCPGPRVGV